MSNGPDSQGATKVLPPRLLPGQCLKHFRLEDFLGEGGMGQVYRAFDSQLCRPVAVKVLPPSLTAEPERRQRFLQEARAAARINHPAVAQIFYADEQDGVTFLVMELVEGQTIRELIENQQLDLLGAVDIASQVADGLAKAHELGIVHRDIKPANVMINGDGHAKILDFGLAKLLGNYGEPGAGAVEGAQAAQLARTTLPGVVMGTAAYMSPEQVRGATVDGRTDLFSLGVLLFEMVTGKSPFQRENFVDSLHAVAFEEPPSLASLGAHVPNELERILSRCLKKQPAERYPDARSLARDLRELRRQSEAGVASKTAWRFNWTATWDRVRRVTPAQALGIGVALGLVALVLFVRPRAPQVGVLDFLILMAVAFGIYRRFRLRRPKMQERFVKRAAKIPEVLLITFHADQFTIVVERPVVQLYSRINALLSACNRKLLFGQPMTVAIVPDASEDKTRQLLESPGVQYVRPDVLKRPPKLNPP